MNQLRTRFLLQMLFIGLGPLTVFTLGMRFMPGGLLPWLWYAFIALAASMVALAFSGRAARPLKQAIHSFRGLVHPEKGDLGRNWVSKEFWDVREDLKTLLKDYKAKVADLEAQYSKQQWTTSAAENAAIRSLEVLHGLVETIPDGVVFMHSDGHVALINARCMEIFELQEHEAEPGMDALGWLRLAASRFPSPKALAQEWEAWQKGSPALMEGEWITSGANPQVITTRTFGIRAEDGSALGRIWLFKDITEERLVSQRLNDSQKMESMGQLAGGIAHDFNNLLTAIRGSLSLAQLDGVEIPQRREHLENASRAAARATELVGHILGYSRNKTAGTTTNVSQLIIELQNLLKASLDPKVVLHCRAMNESWTAEMPHVQLEQVLLNLCLNARDALGEKGGIIAISTSHFSKTSHGADAEHSDIPLGDYIVIHIKDDGVGIPEAVCEHLFEPFFTTKAPGKGTGLGLAISNAIITEGGGWIEFDTTVGVGTEFRVFLPRGKAPALAASALPQRDASKPRPGTAEGTILVVDDETAVRSIAVNMLKYLGYKVLEAPDGEAALTVLGHSAAEIDAVMLDVHMPRLSGRDTFRLMRERGFDMPVIVCSGFMVEAGDFKNAALKNRDSVVVIQKPYSMDTLARAAARAISQVTQGLPA
jgi:two-component system cell cycle sensor histidine kinase/response regulator CckA